MTEKEFAALLNGRERGSELSEEESKLAEEHGLVVIYGASNLLVKTDGAISSELEMNKCLRIFSPYGDDGWAFKAPFPVETFQIKKDGELFCEGIVFHKSKLFKY